MREHIESYKLCDFSNKEERLTDYISQMLDRTNKMFEIKGLPEQINARQLEKRLQTHGYLIWFMVKDEDINNLPDAKPLKGGLYALWGGVGGVVDLNDDFTFAIITHPRLNKSFKLKIGEECVLMRNDSLSRGLLPMFEKYATLLVENDITIQLAEIQSRIVSLITAGNDKTKASADLFINDIKNGRLNIILDKSPDELFQLKTLPYSNNASNTITNLIELEQYIKACWFNELGLSSNYNMKREAINSNEAQLGKDALMPLIDDMLHERQNAYEEINKLFGTNITCEFHTPWLEAMESLTAGEEAITEDIDGSGSVNVDSNNEDTEGEAKEGEGEGMEDYNRNLQKRVKRGTA